MHFATLSSLLLLAISLPLALAHPFNDNGLDGRDSPPSPNVEDVTNVVTDIASHAPIAVPPNQRGDTSSDELFGRDDAEATISKGLHDAADEATSHTPRALQNIVRDDTPVPLPKDAPIKPEDIKDAVSQVAKDPTNAPNVIKEHVSDALPHDAKPSAAPPASKRNLKSLIHQFVGGAHPDQGDSPNRRDGTSDSDFPDEYLQKVKDVKNSIVPT